MNKSFISILFLFSICLFGQTTNRYEWIEIKSPTSESIFFLYGDSLDNMWFYNKSGKIFNLRNDKWQKFNPPTKKAYTRDLIISDDKGEFYLAAMDSLWRTDFFYFENNKWKQFKFQLKVPLQTFFKSANNLIYGFGNFGAIIKISNNRIEKITSNLKSHINYAAKTLDGKIILLTKSEGIFSFDNENIIELNKDSDINFLSMNQVGNRIFLTDDIFKTYELIKGKIVKLDKNQLPSNSYINERGIRFLNLITESSKNKIELPAIYSLISVINMNDGTILSTTNKGKILLAKKTNSIRFWNLAKPFAILGSQERNPINAIASDINNDGLTDLAILYQAFSPSINIYIQDKLDPFYDKSNMIEKIDGFQISSGRSFDFDNDGFKDLIYVAKDSTGVYLNFLKNSKTKFTNSNKLRLPKNWTNYGPSSLTPVDIDNDGDLDICLTYYYGENDDPGFTYFLKNNFWGNSWSIDSSYKSLTKGWNINSLFADIDNDNKIDWLIINKWRKPQLLINHDGKFIDESDSRIIPRKLSEDYSAGIIDFDNDGDIDIIISSDQNLIQIFLNDGNGYFSEKTLKSKFDHIKHKTGFRTTLKFSDYNANGYTDIILSETSDSLTSFLFINDSAKTLIDATKNFHLNSNQSLINLTGDLDNDGDIDFYQTNFDKNQFWSNNLNHNNFIKFNLHGISSNTDALGAKIWLYENNETNKKLIGYRQIGSYEFAENSQSDIIAHFNVNQGMNYSAKIRFPNGLEREFIDIKPGNKYEIYEHGKLYSLLLYIPNFLFQTIINKEVQSYFVIICIVLIILFWGIKYGVKRFNWDIKVTMIITSVNLSLTWIIIFLTSNYSNFLLKYFFPLGIAIVGISLPILMFTFTKKQLIQKYSNEQLENELLQLLLTFSHGEWALRNINSLQLFFSNFSRQNLASEKYCEKILNRVQTFLELTQITLIRIIELSELLVFDEIKTKELKDNLNKSTLFLNQINDLEILKNTEEFNFLDAAKIFNNIKIVITDFRLRFYSKFSCSPNRVINQVSEIFEQIIKDEKIEFNYENLIGDSFPALIKNSDLADVLDNLIRNSIRAMRNSEIKKLNITLKRIVPKIHIEVSDSGMGIKKKDWTDIFQRGFSLNKSSGEGLYSTKMELEKYGGRIYIKSSRINFGTTFTIELLEGVSNETTTIID